VGWTVRAVDSGYESSPKSNLGKGLSDVTRSCYCSFWLWGSSDCRAFDLHVSGQSWSKAFKAAPFSPRCPWDGSTSVGRWDAKSLNKNDISTKSAPESKKAFCKIYHRLLVYRRKLRSILRKVQWGGSFRRTYNRLGPWVRVVESNPGTDGVVGLMRLQTPTGKYIGPVQRFNSFEVGDDREILWNLKDGRCYVPQPNVEKSAACLLSHIQARTWRGWPMKVTKRYMWRLLKMSVILKLGGCCEKSSLFRLLLLLLFK
jgi:hypothetical protein